MQVGWLFYFFLLYLPCISLGRIHETFDEELSIKTLQDGKVLSRFKFTTVLEGASPRDPRTLEQDDQSQHYTFFPLALGQILREYAVSELHLTLNAGKWTYDRWGAPEEDGVGTGAELWAWMGDEFLETSIDQRWMGLRNALAGLFCASLGSMDEKRTTSPLRSFRPEGDLPDWGVAHHIRHATMPSENVCTENLTPFLKLLPCKSFSGIATLLNPHRLFDTDWHGMGIHVLWHEGEGVEVRLTFQSVSDPLRLPSIKKQDWSLKTLFDRTVDRTCPAARSSRVIVALPTDSAYGLTPESSSNSGRSAVFDVISAQKPLNVALSWAEDFQYPLKYDVSQVPFSVQRTLKGSSQAKGYMSLSLTNRLPTTQHLLYLETMPWIVHFYLHTLQASVDGIRSDDIISNVSYVPAVPHSSPAAFECVLALPPKSIVVLNMEISKAFLRYTEHPPDAQRGWDLPPAVFTPLDDVTGIRNNRIYSSVLLVDLATPDFSMPYNVIIFTCSLMAFIFGSIFNLLTRKFVVVNLNSEKS